MMRLQKTAKELRQLRRTITGFRTDVSLRYFEEVEGVVQGGCLTGFRIVNEHSWGTADLCSKLLGFYEQQNQDIFTQSSKPTLVDLGAADGYWGVGLVQAGHFERSICFEQKRRGRRVIQKTAAANGVSDKVSVFGTATRNSIDEALHDTHRPEELFFLIDIEGAEFDLLTFEFLSNYRASEFLIELHAGGEWLDGEKQERLLRDAAILFDCEIIDDTKRDLLQLRTELALPDDLTWILASEGRLYPMRWLHLKPRKVPATAQPAKPIAETAQTSDFGTLWLGDELGLLERACLQSMQSQGYNPLLYSYSPLKNVPQGVEVVDAREIYEPNRVIRHIRYNSPAIHADVFRYHMVRKTGAIWLDTDMFMVKPASELLDSVAARKGFCIGAVLKDSPKNRSYHSLFNNAVFGLPADSRTLLMLGEVFDENERISDTWSGLKRLFALNDAVDRQEPKPFGKLRWGATGPMALTEALNTTGEASFAHDHTGFYNVTAKQMPDLARPDSKLVDFLAPTTFGLHLWGRGFRAAIANGHRPDTQTALRDILQHAD